ncbi:MAG: SOS response-associated peptidase [Deltaproteobacteria bacterium]|nr:SOS response-associated peptidase [Deltaproteobacteria bacterium]MBW2362713.1 SOS response-associated peptidase [Deltaproteobacteria bacterium]
MCGRLGLYATPQAVAERFGVAVEVLPEFAPHYNIAPSAETLAIGAGPHGRTGRALRWGLVPRSAQSPRQARNLARRESLRRYWRTPLEAHRCLVVASGFYEWQASPAGAGGESSRPKTPFWIARRDARPLGLAALYSTWHPPDGGASIVGFAILTRPSRGPCKPIHDRMPIELPPESFDAWLDPELTELDALCRLVDEPSPAEALTAHAVSTAVNAARNEGPQLIEPADGGCVEGLV